MMNSDSLLRPFVRPLGSLLLIAAVLLWSAAALAEGGSVRYSYEQVELGTDSDWVLVPRAAPELGGKVDRAKIEQAFSLLKRDKGPTYGNSSIRVTGRAPERAKVVVEIDKNYGQYAIIIMAETVYTLTELGVPEVQFPGYFKGGMKRQDVPFAAYALTVPLWKALPVGKMSDGQVRMPDGELVPIETVYSRWKKDDAALEAALFDYLEAPDTYTRVSVLGLLPNLDIDYAEKAADQLDHPSVAVRTAALSALEKVRDDDKVLAAVLDMLGAEKDATLARKAAVFLGKAKSDTYNIHQSFFLIDRGSDDEAAEAVAALAKRKGDERAIEKLAEALADKREAVAQNAVTALEALDADAVQMAALDREEVAADLRLQIARQLADDRDAASKRTGLTYVAEHTVGRSAWDAIAALGEMGGDEARKAVESFLKADEIKKREAAADTLVAMGDPAALDAMADAVAKADDARELEQAAYELMVAQPLSAILERADARDKTIRRIAYRALGERALKEKAGPKVFDKLVEGTKSGDEAVRGASARALGVFANDRALEVLETMTDDKSAQVRADVALALGNFKDGQLVDTLYGYLDADSPQVVAGAVAALTKRRDAAKWKTFKSLAEHDSPVVRQRALEALGSLVSPDDKQGLREVISILSGAVSDDSQRVQLTALEQLGRFNDEQAVTGIAIQMNAEKPVVRQASIRALGQSGHPSATPLVVEHLADKNPEIRRAAILALGQLGDGSAKSALEKQLETETNPALAALIEQTLKKL